VSKRRGTLRFRLEPQESADCEVLPFTCEEFPSPCELPMLAEAWKQIVKMRNARDAFISLYCLCLCLRKRIRERLLK